MSTPAYPADYTGIAESNLVKDELHTLTEINDATYRIIIPTFAPFYINNFKFKHITTIGEVVELKEGIDYDFTLRYEGATRSIGQQVFGAITVHTELINGVIKIDYQTVGGEWIADPNYVLNYLATINYNPRMTVWDLVTNVQQTFPPINHEHDFEDLKGQEELIKALNDLEVAILNEKPVPTEIVTHITNINNPHNVTKDQLGLGKIVNLPISTDEDVLGRNAVDSYITLRQVLMLYTDISRFDEFVVTINDINKEIKAIKDSLVTSDTNSQEALDTVKQLSITMADVNTRIASMNSRIDTLELRMANAEIAINELKNQLG